MDKKVLTDLIRAHEAQEQSGEQIFVAFDWTGYIRCENKEDHGHCALELLLDDNELLSRT